LTNSSGAAISLTSLTLASAVGSIDAAALTPITGHYDSTGNSAVDNNNPWTITSPAGSHTLFSEATTGDAGMLANGQQISLAAAGGWIRSPNEDMTLTLMNGGGLLAAGVSYIGNGGQAFGRSDLDFNGDVDVADWSVFTANSYSSLAGLSHAEAYGKGDLDGDLDNDFTDFRLFKQDFNSANGAGAFEAMIGYVPEPAGSALALLSFLVTAFTTRASRTRQGTNHDSSTPF
jgi:hypothetical protein